MFNPKDRNKLQRYLAKKPTEAVVLPEKKAVVVAAEPAYQQQQQQQQQRRPKNHRQQLEQKATSAAVKAATATVVVDKSDEPRKLKQKKMKGKKMIAGNDGDEQQQQQQQQQISTAEEEEVRSTKVDSDGGGENLSSKKNMKKKNKKKKKAKEGKSGQAAVAVDDGDADDKSEPTKQNSKKKQKVVTGNNSNPHHHNKLQQALSRDVASMIAAFNDKGFVEEDDEDEEGDFDVEDDLEDEVYEEKEEEEAEEVEEPRAKKAKKEEEKEKEAIINKKNLNQKNLNNNKTASAESAKDNNSEAIRRSAELGAKAKQTLAASMFRSLNELLYTSDSKESRRKFTAAQFRLYHQAYEGLAAQWPLQPVEYLIDILKKRLQKRKKNEAGNFVIADVGCGSRARIAEALLPDFSNIEVYSYDLYSSEADSSVISADMARLPLDSATVDAAVYSLSLMPTNLKDIVREANRILKPSGQLLVVEVASRFADYQSGSADRRGSLNVAKKDGGKEKVVNLDLQRFAADLKPYGFSLTASEPLPPNGFFLYLAFKKTGDAERLTPKSRLPEIVLKACLYKAR